MSDPNLSERYKVRAPSQSVYEAVRDIARSGAKVVLENERRRSLSIERPSEVLIDDLKREGATVEPEYHYELDLAVR